MRFRRFLKFQVLDNCSKNIVHSQTNVQTHLCAVFPLSLDEDCGLQIVVPAGPEGALKEGAALNSCLDFG